MGCKQSLRLQVHQTNTALSGLLEGFQEEIRHLGASGTSERLLKVGETIPRATSDRYEKYIDGYNTIKEKQTKTTAERNEVRDSYLHLPEGQRIFVHGEPPDFEQPQAIKDFLGSVPPTELSGV